VLAEHPIKIRMAVQSRADSRTALRNGEKAGQRILQTVQPKFHLARPGGEFVSQRHRDRVHHVRAADLYDVRPLRCTLVQRRVERGKSSLQPFYGFRGRDVHHVGKLSFEDWPRLT
jgi:hypothetical protein